MKSSVNWTDVLKHLIFPMNPNKLNKALTHQIRHQNYHLQLKNVEKKMNG